jgi:hypothetical protein
MVESVERGEFTCERGDTEKCMLLPLKEHLVQYGNVFMTFASLDLSCCCFSLSHGWQA